MRIVKGLDAPTRAVTHYATRALQFGRLKHSIYERGLAVGTLALALKKHILISTGTKVSHQNIKVVEMKRVIFFVSGAIAPKQARVGNQCKADFC